jgi:hypothetical protein
MEILQFMAIEAIYFDSTRGLKGESTSYSNLYAISLKLSIVIYSNILYGIAYGLSPLIAQKCYPELPICGKHPAPPVFGSQFIRSDINEKLISFPEYSLDKFNLRRLNSTACMTRNGLS